jgi:hypothetical protein
MLFAQEDDGTEKDMRPVRNLFESTLLIDNQTAVVPIHKTFQFDIQHRFGTVDNGYDDFYGIFAPSNIRLGLNYVPINKLQIGLGFTKDNRLVDFSGKYAILQQGREGGSPVHLTYLVNMAIDFREDEKSGYDEKSDHFSYFHQLMVARKFSRALSMQASANLSFFNFVQPSLDKDGEYLGLRENNVLSASVLGRYKITSTTGVIVNFDVPISKNDFFDIEPNLSFGVELVSSSHAFQIFIGNYQSIIPQFNHFYNGNSFSDSKILIGFNMTRLWNY